MEVKEVSITKIDFDEMLPADVFTWLEEFGFKRYGAKYHVDPSKRDDPRYPAEQDESPVGWYTHLAVPSYCYDKTMFIIDYETFEKIKNQYHSLHRSMNSPTTRKPYKNE